VDFGNEVVGSVMIIVQEFRRSPVSLSSCYFKQPPQPHAHFRRNVAAGPMVLSAFLLRQA